jgi:hypothetical protein
MEEGVCAHDPVPPTIDVAKGAGEPTIPSIPYFLTTGI